MSRLSTLYDINFSISLSNGFIFGGNSKFTKAKPTQLVNL